MLFEQIRSGGCLSYLIGCDDSCAAMLVDPHLDQCDRYLALASERGMRIRYVAFALAGLALVSVGCNRSVALLAPEQTIINDILTGSVLPPVNGELQRTFKTFTVGQGGGDVTVTLSSAIQSLPDGTQQTNVMMGLGAGTVSAGLCVVPVTAYVTTRPGTTPQLAGSLAPGTYCVQVSDITIQTGPVVFSVTVTHP